MPLVCHSLKQGIMHRPTTQSAHQILVSLHLLFILQNLHHAHFLEGLAVFSVGGYGSEKCLPTRREGYGVSRLLGLPLLTELAIQGRFLLIIFSARMMMKIIRDILPPRCLYAIKEFSTAMSRRSNLQIKCQTLLPAVPKIEMAGAHFYYEPNH